MEILIFGFSGILCALIAFGLLLSELPPKAPFPEVLRRPRILAGFTCLLASALLVILSIP